MRKPERKWGWRGSLRSRRRHVAPDEAKRIRGVQANITQALDEGDGHQTLAKLTSAGFSNADVGLAAAFGLGLDINLTKAFAVRVVQADYLVTRLDASDLRRQNKENLRVSTGVSFRFGK